MQNLNRARRLRCARHAGIRSDQRCTEHLRECDVARVVGREIVTELPATSRQSLVGRSPQWETAEIRQSKASSKPPDLSGAKQTAQRGRHLEIDQLRRCEVLMSYASSSHVSPPAVIDKYGD